MAALVLCKSSWPRPSGDFVFLPSPRTAAASGGDEGSYDGNKTCLGRRVPPPSPPPDMGSDKSSSSSKGWFVECDLSATRTGRAGDKRRTGSNNNNTVFDEERRKNRRRERAVVNSSCCWCALQCKESASGRYPFSASDAYFLFWLVDQRARRRRCCAPLPLGEKVTAPVRGGSYTVHKQLIYIYYIGGRMVVGGGSTQCTGGVWVETRWRGPRPQWLHVMMSIDVRDSVAHVSH